MKTRVSPAPSTSRSTQADRRAGVTPVDSLPFTRTSGIWVAVCVAALSSVLIIVFLLQNQQHASVRFLWMHGSLPMSLALLIAATSVAIPGALIGTARIQQLKRALRDRAAAEAD